MPTQKSSPFAVAVRYNLWHLGIPEQEIVATILWEGTDFEKVISWAQRGEADYLIIQDAEGVMDEATNALGLQRINHEMALFVWRDGASGKLKSWPIPAGLIRP